MRVLEYYYAKLFNKPRMRTVLFQLTEKCNSKCKMCSIWKNTSPREMSIPDFERIVSNSELKDINVSLIGGETFLYPYLVDAVEILSRKKIPVATASNCFSPKWVTKKAIEINNLVPYTFCASLDGLKEEHDKIRGVKGAYSNTINTIHLLQAEGIKTNISFTITPNNYDKIMSVYNSINYGSFSCRLASTGNYFRNIGKEFEFTEPQKAKIVTQLKEVNKTAHYYLLEGVSKFIQGKRLLLCGAGYFSIYINPVLDVFPCTHCTSDWLMGNLKDYNYSIEKLVNSSRAKLVRKLTSNCSKCINDIEFDATYSMQQLKCGFWLLKRKPIKLLEAILGLGRWLKNGV